ncbi:hypothetical protein GCM10010400_57560 [Streptomyces aculeolatus]
MLTRAPRTLLRTDAIVRLPAVLSHRDHRPTNRNGPYTDAMPAPPRLLPFAPTRHSDKGFAPAAW